MDLTVLITALLLLALFVLPFYLIAHSKKHASDQTETQEKVLEKGHK